MEYFTTQQLDEFINALVSAQINYGVAKPAFTANIDPFWLGAILPDTLGMPPIAQLNIDLSKLNKTARLADGTVPFQIWLRNAALMTTGTEQNKVFQRALDDLTHRTTGAPRIDASNLPEYKEVIVGHDDTLPFFFLKNGAEVGTSVARLSVPRYEQGQKKMLNANPMLYVGTGWVIGPELVITNHHVINAREEGEAPAGEGDLKMQAANTVAKFDFDYDAAPGEEHNAASLEAWDAALDYAILSFTGLARPPLRMTDAPLGKTGEDDFTAVNIVQHPEGTSKRIAVRNNLITGSTDSDLRYFTDTKQGSSGSPVLDDQWRVVALHRGSTVADNVKFQGKSVAWVNLGTHITKILEHLKKDFPDVHDKII